MTAPHLGGVGAQQADYLLGQSVVRVLYWWSISVTLIASGYQVEFSSDPGPSDGNEHREQP